MEFEQKALVMMMPSRAILSMLGVGLSGAKRPPYAPMACAVWSSDMMKRILGFSTANKWRQESMSKQYFIDGFLVYFFFFLRGAL